MNEFFQNSAVQLQAVSELRINLVSALGAAPNDPVTQRALELLTRHLRVFGKLFRRMQRDAKVHFVSLPMCGDLVLYYWSKVVQATTGSPEQIAGMTCWYSLLLEFEYDCNHRLPSCHLPCSLPRPGHGTLQG